MLADTARKEAQIKEINRLSALVDALVALAKGDDTALDGFESHGISEPITSKVVPINFAAPVDTSQVTQAAPSTPAFVGQAMPLPDCPLCGAAGDAPGHVANGQACKARQADAARNATHTWTPGTAFVPAAPPAEFAPSSEEDNE